jgi:hypothetical protein
MAQAIKIIIALVIVTPVVYFIGSIAMAMYFSHPTRRMGRRLSAKLRPMWRAQWKGKVDDLQERLLVEMRGHNLGAQPAPFGRPAIALYASQGNVVLNSPMLVLTLRRDGRTRIRIELRSGSPIRRPKRASCTHTIDAIDAALRTIGELDDLSRPG